MAKKINPEMDMKAIRNDGGEVLKLLYETLENITIGELKKCRHVCFGIWQRKSKEVKMLRESEE